MEQRLYRIVMERKVPPACNTACSARRRHDRSVPCQVTYITIAHRPTLRAYHDRLLAIGDGKHGFTLTDIENTDIKKKVAPQPPPRRPLVGA
jgi:hypothetical protein